jgi:hypothetical protein
VKLFRGSMPLSGDATKQRWPAADEANGVFIVRAERGTRPMKFGGAKIAHENKGNKYPRTSQRAKGVLATTNKLFAAQPRNEFVGTLFTGRLLKT